MITWAATVTEMRARAERERWRLAAVARLAGWREFVVAWRTAAASPPAALRNRPRPHGPVEFDDLLAWTWAEGSAWADAALAAVDARVPYGTVQTLSVFVGLRGAALIFPDGEVLGPLLERITRAESLKDLSEAEAHQARAERLEEGVARAKARQKKQEAKDG